jgi:dihydrodiol dehydrogenase / D-xylose 1-dehydrogenase (NADP)
MPTPTAARRLAHAAAHLGAPAASDGCAARAAVGPAAGYREETPASNNGMYGPEGLPFATPLDIRKGLTSAEGVRHALRWGILSASAIASDWIKSLQDVPGASVVACAARDPARAAAYAADHGIARAHADYAALCADPAVDIVYIGTKTADHAAHMLLAIGHGKHVLCEKPFTDTATQAREVYAAAEAKGLFCQEGMWLRYFPAFEHARAAIELGVIGDVKQVSADYPDRVYALTPAPFAFGAAANKCPEAPTVAATGRVGGPSAVVLGYGDQGVGVHTFPQGRFEEETIIVGTAGRIKLLKPSHHPTHLEIYSGGYEGSQGSWGTQGDHGYDGRRDGWNEPSQHGVHVERVYYPLPEPAGERGMPPGKRWDPALGVVEYKGWSWGHGNMHGFVYQAQAVHRCLAAGLTGCPQFTREESVHTCDIIDEIDRQLSGIHE